MNKNNGSFWPSYVDVMTTLFAITLVLFAVSYVNFKKKQKALDDMKHDYDLIVKEYKDIITTYATINEIDKTEYFKYDSIYLKHLFQVTVEYQMGKFDVANELKQDGNDNLAATKIRRSIVRAGKQILETIQKFQKSENDNVKFLIVIEGQSSKIPYGNNAYQNNYTLSYLRAQYLNEFWKSNGIDFTKIDKCELIISGSGEGGVPRIPSSPMPQNMHSIAYQKWAAIESANQRFLIHIVPVIGNIKDAQSILDRIRKQKEKWGDGDN